MIIFVAPLPSQVVNVSNHTLSVASKLCTLFCFLRFQSNGALTSHSLS